MVNGDNVYDLPSLPVLAPLNHVITWIPELGVYADTTVGVAPFGSLPYTEVGKPVIHVRADGPVMHTTPLGGVAMSTASLKSTLDLSASGQVSGISTVTATGAASIALRAVALGIQGSGDTAAAKYLFGAAGSGSFTYSDPRQLDNSYQLSAKMTFPADPEQLTGKPFYLPPGLRVLSRPGDGLMGSLAWTDPVVLDTTACISGKQTDDLSLTIPSGKKIAQVPKDADVETANLSYRTHWTVNGHAIAVHREFASHVASVICSGQVRKETAAALKQISDDYDLTIWLVDDQEAEKAPAENGTSTVQDNGPDPLQRAKNLAASGQIDEAI